MSDFYKARLAATYTPASTTGVDPNPNPNPNPNPPPAELPLIRHNNLLAEPPTLEWSLQTASYEYIAHEWAGDLPTGNARLTLAAQPLVRANTRAALERKLRHLELQLNLHRTGTLLLEEAYTQGVPTLHTYWTAVIETANAAPLPLDQAPPIPGAWGKLDLSIILTNPSLEDPLSRQSSEGAEEDNPNPNPNPDNPEDPGSQEEYYATGWVDFRLSCSPESSITIGGITITAIDYSLNEEQWASLINAANCGVTATPDPDNTVSTHRVLLTATSPGAQGELLLSTNDTAGILFSGPTLVLPPH